MKLYDDYHNSIMIPDELSTMVKLTAPRLRDWLSDNPTVTHIAATGTSGLAAAFPLSLKAKLPVLVVRRKGGEPGAHSGNLVGAGHLGDYVIVDDFISGGGTMNHVISSINTAWERRLRDELDTTYNVPGWNKVGERPICRGIFLYQAYSDRKFQPELKRDGEYETAPLAHFTGRQTALDDAMKFVHPEIPCFAMLDEAN